MIDVAAAVRRIRLAAAVTGDPAALPWWLRRSAKLALVAELAADLADSREREGALRERVAWFEAALPDHSPLHLVQEARPLAPRRRA